MGGRPAPERSARPQGGADLRHLARRGDTQVEEEWNQRAVPPLAGDRGSLLR